MANPKLIVASIALLLCSHAWASKEGVPTDKRGNPVTPQDSTDYGPMVLKPESTDVQYAGEVVDPNAPAENDKFEEANRARERVQALKKHYDTIRALPAGQRRAGEAALLNEWRAMPADYKSRVGERFQEIMRSLQQQHSQDLKPNPGREVLPPVVGELGRDLITTDPKNPRGYQMVGESALIQQDYKGAYNNLHRAIQLGAKDPDTFAGYSAAALNLGDTRLAQEAAALALRMRPGHGGAFGVMKLSEGRSPTINLPSALASGGSEANQNTPEAAASTTGTGQLAQPQPTGMTEAQVAAAIQKQLSAQATPAQKSAALTRDSATYLRVEDYGAAYAMATKAIELNGHNVQAWTYRAMANNSLQRYPDAVSDASTALKLAPSNAVSLQTRSMSYALMGKYQDALADANRTIESDPRSGQAYYNRAFALAGLGERDESLESLKKAAEVAPQFQPVYQNALQLPEEADMMLIFKPQNVTITAAPVSPEAKKKRFVKTILTTISGGLLVALGLLHVLSASWREKVHATVRRVLGTQNPVAADAAPNATPTPGSGFWSGYTLNREIGIGGMGVVYEAIDGALNRRVAIKKMRDEIRVDPTERRRFITEARTVAALHHHHIVDIYSIVEDDNDVYLVFEYIDGKTLAEMLRDKGAFPYEDAKRIMKGVCSAIDYAHRQNVIHRDLKPSNVMLTGEGHVKVMDFGVARQAKEALTKMSMTNSVVGTPPYMAPEQEQGTVRRESDVFALGICLYELVTGKLPFTGQGAGMLLNKINGKHIPPSQVNPSLPPEVDAIVAKALNPDPDKRYRTASELWAALEGQATARVG